MNSPDEYQSMMEYSELKATINGVIQLAFTFSYNEQSNLFFTRLPPATCTHWGRSRSESLQLDAGLAFTMIWLLE